MDDLEMIATAAERPSPHRNGDRLSGDVAPMPVTAHESHFFGVCRSAALDAR